MDLKEYQRHVGGIGFGKRLPTAIYVYRGDGMGDCGKELNDMVGRLVAGYGVGPEFNVIKFRTDELKVSFLSYPGFFDDPHPVLRHAITIDLAMGKARHTDYAGNLNPPILHRKESFLPADHPRRGEFEALTRAEEEAGLYEKTATIGFKLNWERLLAAKGVTIVGHQLVCGSAVTEEGGTSHKSPEVHRHKTAMTRYELSKPVKSLLEYGLLQAGTTFLLASLRPYFINTICRLSFPRRFASRGLRPLHRPQASPYPRRSEGSSGCGHA